MPHAMTTAGGKFNSFFKRDRPPPVPEKDVYLAPAQPLGPYASSSFSRSAVSVTTSSVGRAASPRSGTLDSTTSGTQLPSPASPSSPKQNGNASARGMSTLRKAIAKIPGKIPPLPRRPSNNSLATSATHQSTASASDDHGDDKISLPWNIQHDLHVEPIEDGLAGLPSSWSNALSKAGFSEEEIQAMYSRQRRLPSSFASNTPPITPHSAAYPTTIPSPMIVPPMPVQAATLPHASGRSAPTLPRTVSPTSSAGQRPYSPDSSRQSTFTSDFPSEFGSIRMRKETFNRGESPPPPLPTNAMSIPRKAPPLSIDPGAGARPSFASSSISTSQQQAPVAEPVPPPASSASKPTPESPAEVHVHPPPSSEGNSVFSDDSSEKDNDDDSLSAPHAPDLHTPSSSSSSMLSPTSPISRAPLSPPRLTLSAGNEDGEWSSSLLSSFGGDLDFSLGGDFSFLSSPTLSPSPSQLNGDSSNPDSPTLRSSTISPRLPIGQSPLSQSVSSAYSSSDRDQRRDTIRPDALLTPTPNGVLSHQQQQQTSALRSPSLRSTMTGSSSREDASSSRGSLDDVEDAAINSTQILRRVSVSGPGQAKAVAVRAKRQSATMRPSANGAPPVLAPAPTSMQTTKPLSLTAKIASNAPAPAAGPLAAVLNEAMQKKRPPPIREYDNVSPSPSADEPPTPGLTNNSRKSTEHTDASSSIRSPMASPMAQAFSKGAVDGKIYEEDEEEDGGDNGLDEITSAYASDAYSFDDRSTRRYTQLPRGESDIEYLSSHPLPPATHPPEIHTSRPSTPPQIVTTRADRSQHLFIPSPVSASPPASASSFTTTYAMYADDDETTRIDQHKHSPFGTSPSSLPRSPMSANALTPRAATSTQSAGKLSPHIGAGLVLGAALAVHGTGLQTPVASSPSSQRSPISPLDKDLPRPPSDPTIVTDARPASSSSRRTSPAQQQNAADEAADAMMLRSQKLFEPLNPYLSATDPLVRFSDLTQVAEGQWGPVFAARARDAATMTKATSAEGSGASSHASSTRFGTLVAVKTIKVEEERSPKVIALAAELAIMANIRHEFVLATAGLFVSEDTLWVEMELMERSLADILPLIDEGLVVSEPEVARFASDVLTGLAYLETLNIAHRDVRSDNLLLSRNGAVKLADFSQAVITQKDQLLLSVVPVPPYWMAPEMRLGRPYDAHLVDIWSVGATIWEVIEGSPPFLDIEDPREFPDRWPALRRSGEFSVSLHQFLRLCSEQDDWRPRAAELLETPFIEAACPRNDIITLLAEVRLLEDGLYEK